MSLTKICSLLIALASVGAQADTRRNGDQLSLALPIGTVAVELLRGDTAGAWQMAQTFALTTGLTEILKKNTGVTRPDGSDDRSFPSGHAARAFSAAAYVQQRHGWEKAWPLWVAATYVGYSRVDARRHRWSEVAVAGGMALGFAAWRVEPLGAKLEAAAIGPGAYVGLRWQL